jgi:hypothetical protein
MGESEDQKENNDVGWRPKAWHGRLIAAMLLGGAALHAFKPSWITLDWPTIVMILVGVFLILVPLNDLGAVIESLEIGKTKILFRKVKQLDESVERAVNEEVVAAQAAPTVAGENAEADEDETEDIPEPPRVYVPRSAWGDSEAPAIERAGNRQAKPKPPRYISTPPQYPGKIAASIAPGNLADPDSWGAIRPGLRAQQELGGRLVSVVLCLSRRRDDFNYHVSHFVQMAAKRSWPATL